MVRAGKRFFQRALREVQEEGAGVMRIELLFRENALDLLAASAVGNKDARLRVRFLAEAAKLTRTGKPMCLLCDNRPLFQNARVIVLFYGDKVDPSRAIINLICQGCGDRLGDPKSITRAAIEKYKSSVIGIREIVIHPATGTA